MGLGGPLPAPRPAGAGLWRCPGEAPSLLCAVLSDGFGAVPPPQAGEGWDMLLFDGSPFGLGDGLGGGARSFLSQEVALGGAPWPLYIR